MLQKTEKEWVLPASLPLSDLKAKDLEACVYWLLDAMGAKDLEWRTGGSGGGAADGGRDLEAHFYTPSADNEIEPQTWWIECKGRSATVESDEVKSAVINAQARGGLDYVVIVTNTQFSNPTRDWVKEWQLKNPRPKVKLWDHSDLERLLSRHPAVVLRLFSEALSLDGRFQAMEKRFWNRLEFVPEKTLSTIWHSLDQIELSSLGLFAAIVNEFAAGTITERPWGARLETTGLANVLAIGLANAPYLLIRGSEAGVDLTPVTRGFGYLILCALDKLPAKSVCQLVIDSICDRIDEEQRESFLDLMLTPIMGQLLSEMQDVCSSDCHRISLIDRGTLTEDKDEVDDYWLRLEPEGKPIEQDKRQLRIEAYNEPCNVGFSLNKEKGCPLFEFEPGSANVEEFMKLIKRVAAFRKAQARQKRHEEKRREDARRSKPKR